jgi:hypothetical protein
MKSYAQQNFHIITASCMQNEQGLPMFAIKPNVSQSEARQSIQNL